MALTLYVAHIVIGMGILEALGLLTNQPLVFIGLGLTALTIGQAWLRGKVTFRSSASFGRFSLRVRC
jgi:hypothetical protein